MIRLRARRRAWFLPAAGPWFDHALVIALVLVIAACLWLVLYLVLRSLGVS